MIWEHIGIEDEVNYLAQTIERTTVLLLCDRSFQPNLAKERASGAWTVECTTTNQRIMGVIHSITKIANEYRAELTGLYVSMTFVITVTTKY